MKVRQELETLRGRVEALERRLGAGDQPEECRRRECSYYRHYLAYGPGELGHEGYHAAEGRCARAQERALRHLEACPRCGQGRLCPAGEALDRMADGWERRIRA
jgi:hypothetical protein